MPNKKEIRLYNLSKYYYIIKSGSLKGGTVFHLDEKHKIQARISDSKMTMTRTKNMGFSGVKPKAGRPRVLGQKDNLKIEKHIGLEDLEEIEQLDIKESEIMTGKMAKGPIRIMKSMEPNEDWASINSRDQGLGNFGTRRASDTTQIIGNDDDQAEQSDETKIENFHSFKNQQSNF